MGDLKESFFQREAKKHPIIEITKVIESQEMSNSFVVETNYPLFKEEVYLGDNGSYYRFLSKRLIGISPEGECPKTLYLCVNSEDSQHPYKHPKPDYKAVVDAAIGEKPSLVKPISEQLKNTRIAGIEYTDRLGNKTIVPIKEE
jgi:hypothetical protein